MTQSTAGLFQSVVLCFNWICALHGKTGSKALQGIGQWILMWYLWAHWSTMQQQICLFFSPPKGSPQKPLSSASFGPVESICPSIWLVFYPEDGVPSGPWKASLPTWVVTMPSNKITCQESSLFGSVLAPPLLCHFKHVTLMFQTHFSNVLHSI